MGKYSILAVLFGLVASSLALKIDTSSSSLKDYRHFLNRYWDVITTLDSSIDELTIRKSSDYEAEIAFNTKEGFKYHFIPVPSSGSIAFKVKALNDVGIAFAPDPFDLDPILEFFIGESNNMKSGIRYNRTLPNVVEVETPGILNGDEFVSFTLEWGNGAFSAYRAGEPRPFISWSTKAPFPVSYVGLRTSWGANGSWIVQNVSIAEPAPTDTKPIVSVRSDASLHFRVRARNDAHVGLSTTSSLFGPILEIVIGGWSNKRSVIRRGNSVLGDKIGVDIPDFLNGTEYRGFWVKWGRVIAVGREGESCPFMTWTDPDPFEPKYVGIHTGFGSTGDWKVEDMPDLYTPDNTEYKFFPVEQVTGSRNALDSQVVW